MEGLTQPFGQPVNRNGKGFILLPMSPKTLSGSIPGVPLSVGLDPVRPKNNEHAHSAYDELD